MRSLITLARLITAIIQVFALAVILLFVDCAPKSFVVITDRVDNFKGEGINSFYVIHQIDTLNTPKGVFYRLHIQEIPKYKE
jgi:hypothetical protein